MVGLALSDQLKGSLRKGMIVGALSGALSIAVLNGMDGVAVFGHTFPKFAVHTVILGASSVAADYIIPSITPYIAGGDVMWTRFENLSLQPALVGILSLSIESVLCPSATQQGDVLKTIMVGAASSVAASYASSQMGWSAPLA